LTHYGVPDEKQFFSPHCVDNAWFAVEAGKLERAEVRNRLGIGPDESVFLFCGKLIEVKRPLDVLFAAAKACDAGLRCQVIYAGDGPLRGAVERVAKRTAVATTLLGFMNQTQLPAIYLAADALVLPSASETWGLVVNEGMAIGLPAIVSSAVGCVPDLIDAGKTGWVYPVGRIDRLAAAMQQSAGLRCSPDTRAALAKKMSRYSVESAASGALRAANAAISTRRLVTT
jgi:glycosyltransferase involved in cell wall biosynthesis